MGIPISENLVQAVSDARICTYCTVAAQTWLMCDTIRSLPMEVKYLWPAKLSVPKILYLTLRYFTLVDLAVNVAFDTNYHIQHDKNLCEGLLWFKALVALFVPEYIAEALMAMRLYAIYGRSRIALWVVSLLYIVRVSLPIWSAITEALPVKVITYDYSLPTPGCLHGSAGPFYSQLITSTLCVVISMIMLALTLFESLRSARIELRGLSLQHLRDVRRNAPIMHILMRDGTMYFTLVTMADVVFFAIIYTYKDRGLQLAGFPWVAAAYTIAGTRVTLNLRSTPATQLDGTTEYSQEAISTLVFATPRYTSGAPNIEMDRLKSARQDVTTFA